MALFTIGAVLARFVLDAVGSKAWWQRGFALAPVAVQPLLRQVVQASATLIEQAGMTVDYDLPDTRDKRQWRTGSGHRCTRAKEA